MSAPRPALRLLSLNVNGLGQPEKRRTLFHCLAQGHWDIVALQETHHADAEEGATWASAGAGPGHPWAGQAFCFGRMEPYTQHYPQASPS